MSFFSRKKQPAPAPAPVQVTQTPQQAFAQTAQERQQQQQLQALQQQQLQQQQLQQQQQQKMAMVMSPPQQQQLLASTRDFSSPGPSSSQQQLPLSAVQTHTPQQSMSGAPGPSNPSAPAPAPNPTQPSSLPRPAYPWAARRLALPPPLLLPRPGLVPPTAPSPSPFPRYGHSLPLTSTPTGEIFLFGGLVRDVVRNDLYAFSTRDLAASLVQTTGDAPPPRVGHASALLSSVLIVWGGDTKIPDSDKPDEGLYLLNLGTREWTRVITQGPTPNGRYGHAVTMRNTMFFVFGGQFNGEFFNDLWVFDLNSLKTTPVWELITPAPGSPVPSYRTGHVAVTFGEKIYTFGGTDGLYHYNDTWSFDLTTRTWTELTCIGFIPAPREGHAAALVDDVMYVFGGRGVDGKDLGDLAAFKISNQRWYMFQNMGPAPSGRSGHAMASAGSRVFVLGGESFTATRPDDPNVVHVLDTKHIKYPDSNRPPAPPASGAGANRKPSVQPTSPQAQPSQIPSATLPPQSNIPGPSGLRALSPPAANDADDARRAMTASPPGRGNKLVNGTQPFPVNKPVNGSGIPRGKSPSSQVGRLRREDEAAFGSEDERASTEGHGYVYGGHVNGNGNGNGNGHGHAHGNGSVSVSGNMRERAMSPENVAAAIAAAKARSPTPTSVANRAMSPPNGSSIGHGDAQGQSMNALNRSALAARSPSPIATGPPPSDAFYYGTRSKSPSAVNGPSTASSGHSLGKQSSSGNVTADLVRDLKTKDAEIESLRRRELWMRAALERARKDGFVMTDTELEDGESGQWRENADPEEVKSISDMVLKMKQEHAKIQASAVAHAREAAGRFAEADRVRNAALQEAAFYRAKLSAFDSGSAGEVARLERERSNELERQLAAFAATRQEQERECTELSQAVALQTQLREQAEAQAAEATKRAEEAEEAHVRLAKEHAELQENHQTASTLLRNHMDQMVLLNSQVQRHDAEHGSAQEQIKSLTFSRDQHLRALEQAQAVLVASSARAEDMEAQWQRAREQVDSLEAELTETRSELATRTQDAESAAQRLTDAENAWAKSREEADALRALTSTSIGKLLDSHRDIQADEDHAVRGYAEQFKAMEMESASLRKMLKEAGTRVDEVQSDLSEQRKRVRTLESDQMLLRSQLLGVRTQLAASLAEGGRLRKELAIKESELRDKSRAVADAEIRAGMFRGYLVEHGIVVDDNDVQSRSGSGMSNLVKELEEKLAERTRLHEETERELSKVNRRKQDAEAQADLLSTQLDRVRSTRSPDSISTADSRARAAERKLEETEQSHKERLQQMEADYQTAVHYVKGTEKMLRRMKDELNKQKTLNSTIQSELEAVRGGINGKATPVSDDDHDVTRGQLADAQRQVQRLTAENQELRQRIETLQSELAQLQDHAMSIQQESEMRGNNIEDLEHDVERLQAALGAARNNNEVTYTEQLADEVTSLRQENKELSHKIAILLDDQTGYGRIGDRPMSSGSHPHSHTSSENAMVFESLENELNDWQRRLVTSTTSHSHHQPLNDYDPEPIRSRSRPPAERVL